MDLAAFELSSLVDCCRGVRETAATATSMEDAAARIVRYLRGAIRADDDTSAFVLARLFLTVAADDLSPDLRAIVNPDPRRPRMRWLTLLGTDGDKPEWCERRRSVSHRAIPLSSAESVAKAPMVAALVREVGIDLDTFLGEAASTTHDTDFDVFYVPAPVGSSRVPDQGFVREHGIRSVVGFGGVLPTGEVFAVVLFARVTIPPAVADMFRTIGVSTQLALLPLSGAPIFDGGPRRPVDPLIAEVGHAAALRQMLAVHEATVLDQARSLESSLHLLELQDAQLRREAGIIEALQRVGATLGADLDVDRVVREATEAAVDVTEAAFGAFLPHDGSPAIVAGHAPADVGSGDLCVPVVSISGEVHGRLVLGHATPAPFDERARRLTIGIAAQAAAALDNAGRYVGQRRIAQALQASLLTPPPQSTRFALAVRYVPATRHAEVGGDWYDSFVLPGDEVSVVVGDVVGHDLRAAAAMAQVRNVVRTIAVDRNSSPSEIVRHADAAVARLHITDFATMIFGRVETTDGHLVLRWTNAGHPPPLLVLAGGEVTFLGGTPNLPVGIAPTEQREDHLDALPPGCTLLLYTDGLIEKPGLSLSTGMEQLRAAARHHRADPLESFCDNVLNAMSSPGPTDDIALLALRVPPSPS